MAVFKAHRLTINKLKNEIYKRKTKDYFHFNAILK
jgi:hypothetical protein